MVNGSIIRGLGVCLVLAHAGWQSSAVHAQETLPADQPVEAAAGDDTQDGATRALLPPEERLSPEEVAAFLADPAAWLQANPNGGAEMTAAIMKLVASDPRTIDALLALASDPNVRPLQKAAIGAALGRVALAVASVDPALATYISSRIAASPASEAKTSFDLVASQGGLQVLGLDPLPGETPGTGTDTAGLPGSEVGGGVSGGGSLTGGSGTVEGGSVGGGGGTSTGGGSSGTTGTTVAVPTDGGSLTVGGAGTIRDDNGNSNPGNVASPAS